MSRTDTLLTLLALTRSLWDKVKSDKKADKPAPVPPAPKPPEKPE